MISNRSFPLSLEQGQRRRLQLGAPNQTPGIKIINSVVYPRFSGVHLEDSSLPSSALAVGGSKILFSSTTTRPRSFVSGDVQHVGTTVTLPYEGAWRVRIQVAYQVTASANSAQIDLFFNVVSGGVTTQQDIRRNDLSGQGTITFDQVLRISQISAVTITNSGPESVTIVNALSATQLVVADTFLDVGYIGAL